MDRRIDVFTHILPKRVDQARVQRASKSSYAQHVLWAMTIQSGIAPAATIRF
jgi:hypothetical protein